MAYATEYKILLGWSLLTLNIEYVFQITLYGRCTYLLKGEILHLFSIYSVRNQLAGLYFNHKLAAVHETA